jgi:hypothetical protein
MSNLESYDQRNLSEIYPHTWQGVLASLITPTSFSVALAKRVAYEREAINPDSENAVRIGGRLLTEFVTEQTHYLLVNLMRYKWHEEREVFTRGDSELQEHEYQSARTKVLRVLSRRALLALIGCESNLRSNQIEDITGNDLFDYTHLIA